MRLKAFAAVVIAAAVVTGLRMPSWPHIPTRGLMLSPFGLPVSYQTCGFHTGQDWFGREGTPVYAMESGRVVHVGPLWLRGEGVGRGERAIVIEHAEYTSTYSHNRRASVRIGDWVSRGQQIAELGNDGYSGRPHLHLEKVYAEYTGEWRMPFVGCSGYANPGWLWGLF